MKFQPVVALFVLLCLSLELNAQTTAFTYQGKLSDGGGAANGTYDFRFRLFDANTNAVAGPITNSAIFVTNGQFTATLDFGSGVFDGSNRWLEIAVRSNGVVTAFTALSPLQPITSVPYAIQSLNAANASRLAAPLPGTNITGVIPLLNLPTNIAFLNSNQTFSAANTFNGVVNANNSGNVFSGAFIGNGGGLTNLQGTNIVGTIPDARLSTNVALLNNTNNPNLIFAGSITATNFIGAGHGLTNVPGAFFWVVPTNGQMYPNVGYICTNDATNVTLVLPASPSVGDTFKIVGVGAGGWKIAQNTGQTIISGGLASGIGQNWKAVNIKTNWADIACSSDGTKLVAAANGGNIYMSTNSGNTWTKSSAPRTNWSAVASSADGSKLFATVGYVPKNTSGKGNIYKSIDSGANWSIAFVSPLTNWTSIACSADGTKVAAVSLNGPIYLSSDGGSSWVFVTGSGGRLWTSIASSTDGTKMVVVNQLGEIFTNSPTSWASPTNLGPVQLDAVASSADGARLIAAGNGGQIYLSVNSGSTWIALNSPVAGQLAAVASSADGGKLAVAVGTIGASTTGNIYASADSGATFSQLTGSPILSWTALASSFDGSLLAGTAWNDFIYISSQASTSGGASGYLAGSQHSAIELIYVGNGDFLPINHEGTIRAY